VGIVKDGKYLFLGEEYKPCFYLVLNQHYRGELNLHVRTIGPPGSMLQVIRQEIEALDPYLPVHNLKTMEEHLAFARLPARMTAGSIGAFAALALLLTGIGLYGVIAFTVSRGTRELGIRMALGAGPADVLRHVLGRSLLLSAIGLVIGSAVGVIVNRLMASILYGVKPIDPLSFGAALLVVAVTALLAGGMPTRRAIRIDPADTLRGEY
jgi:ABC-type antimicrobial peptide transport system permease subunit